MTMKNDAKLEIELTCHFKIDMRSLANFNPNTDLFILKIARIFPILASRNRLMNAFVIT